MTATHTNDLSDQFIKQVQNLGRELGCSPIDVAGIMFAEGGAAADAWNRSSNAVGLIQFIPSTLEGLGWTAGHDAFRRLTANQQMPFVRAYFLPYAHRGLHHLGRLYQVVFLPASLNWATSPQDALCHVSLTPNAPPFLQPTLRLAYASNASVDQAGKGYIDIADLTMAANQRCAGPRWDELVSRLKASAVPPPRPGPADYSTDQLQQIIDRLRYLDTLVTVGNRLRDNVPLNDPPLYSQDVLVLEELAALARAPRRV